MVKRYDYLDLLRGLSALIVLICHYWWFWDFDPNAPLPARDLLWPIYEFGGIAVQVFWALSGFVFWVAYGKRQVTGRQFWLHRFARLYPLHFVTLLLMAALQAISTATTGTWTVYGNNDLPHFLLQLVMASNWFTMEHSFNAPIWSVSVEVLVYLAFLIFMRAPSLALALLVGAMSAFAYYLTQHQIPYCSALFFGGVAVAMLAPTVREAVPRLTLPLALLSLCGVAAAVVGLAWLGIDNKARLVAMFAGPIALVGVFVALDYRFALPKRWHWIGLITYSVYLIHMPVLISFRLAGWIPPLWLFIAAVIGLSLLSYRYIEIPAQRWIRTWGKLPLSPRRNRDVATMARAPK